MEGLPVGSIRGGHLAEPFATQLRPARRSSAGPRSRYRRGSAPCALACGLSWRESSVLVTARGWAKTSGSTTRVTVTSAWTQSSRTRRSSPPGPTASALTSVWEPGPLSSRTAYRSQLGAPPSPGLGSGGLLSCFSRRSSTATFRQRHVGVTVAPASSANGSPPRTTPPVRPGRAAEPYPASPRRLEDATGPHLRWRTGDCRSSSEAEPASARPGSPHLVSSTSADGRRRPPSAGPPVPTTVRLSTLARAQGAVASPASLSNLI